MVLVDFGLVWCIIGVLSWVFEYIVFDYFRD